MENMELNDLFWCYLKPTVWPAWSRAFNRIDDQTDETHAEYIFGLNEGTLRSFENKPRLEQAHDMVIPRYA